ncbi:MAG: hypothetical protein GEV06_15945 [Luteitalea sp.]|nr:hypothetical protein [Luteitalea sp.]
MRRLRGISRVAVVGTAAVACVCGYARTVAAQSDEIHACASTLAMRIVDATEACRPWETRYVWNQEGQPGPAGPPGPPGGFTGPIESRTTESGASVLCPSGGECVPISLSATGEMLTVADGTQIVATATVVARADAPSSEATSVSLTCILEHRRVDSPVWGVLTPASHAVFTGLNDSRLWDAGLRFTLPLQGARVVPSGIWDLEVRCGTLNHEVVITAASLQVSVLPAP